MGKRGRESKLGPVVTTTVRVPVDLWNWVKAHRGAEFSALLRRAIREAQAEDDVRQFKIEQAQRLQVETAPQRALREFIADRNRRGESVAEDVLAAKRRELGL